MEEIMEEILKKPVIGLVPLYDEEKESYWMLPGYMKGLERAGAVPVMMPLTEDPEVIERLAEVFDGFVLTGGHDVDPALYGEEPLDVCGPICDRRDRMEAMLLEQVLKLNKPVLGICRGLQFLNVYLGGTLYQDLTTQHPSRIDHHMRPPYNRPVHEVIVERSSPLHMIMGKDKLQVNSYHHQAIRTLAPGLQAMARSEDGLVEAAWMPWKRFVAAFQWHPEFTYESDDSWRLFASFVVNCAK